MKTSKSEKVNNLFVICELENGKVAEISQELLTKGRKLADQLGCSMEALIIGHDLQEPEKEAFEYGADVVWLADDPRLEHYTTLPYTRIAVELFKQEKPQVALLGATSFGRDLGPRVSSALGSGLTADCTALEIGEHTDKKAGKTYKNLLLQIRPAFGGNIIATIINPGHKPQMATVREGVMKKEKIRKPKDGEVKFIDVERFVRAEDFVVHIIERHMEESGVNLKGAPVIVSGGYGVGSKENFEILFRLAGLIGAEVGASRAAVDAGFAEHDRQIGQTGVTVRPKLYIACGISGQVQHIAGMQESAMVISINNDPEAPINKIADYAIVGNLEDVIPKMIKYYKQNSK